MIYVPYTYNLPLMTWQLCAYIYHVTISLYIVVVAGTCILYVPGCWELSIYRLDTKNNLKSSAYIHALGSWGLSHYILKMNVKYMYLFSEFLQPFLPDSLLFAQFRVHFQYLRFIRRISLHVQYMIRFDYRINVHV